MKKKLNPSLSSLSSKSNRLVLLLQGFLVGSSLAVALVFGLHFRAWPSPAPVSQLAPQPEAKPTPAPAQPAPVVSKSNGPDKGKKYDVDIQGDFDDTSTASWLKALKDHAEGGRILVRFSSPGGDALAMMAFIEHVQDLKKAHPTLRLACYGEVMVASAAAMSYEALCDERYEVEGTTWLFHGVQGGIGGGNEGQAAERVAMAHALNHQIAVWVAPKLGMTVEEYEAWVLGKDRFLDSDQALEAHAVDVQLPNAETPRGE